MFLVLRYFTEVSHFLLIEKLYSHIWHIYLSKGSENLCYYFHHFLNYTKHSTWVNVFATSGHNKSFLAHFD